MPGYKDNLVKNTQRGRFKYTGEQDTGESHKQSAEVGKKGTGLGGSKCNNVPGAGMTFKIKQEVDKNIQQRFCRLSLGWSVFRSVLLCGDHSVHLYSWLPADLSRVGVSVSQTNTPVTHRCASLHEQPLSLSHTSTP